MQIVIDIPDDFHERVNKDGCMSYTDAEVVVYAFYRGKVLPKGHGALKDVDAIIAKHAMTKYDWRDCVDIEDLRNAPTIIEADKEVDE